MLLACLDRHGLHDIANALAQVEGRLLEHQLAGIDLGEIQDVVHDNQE